VVTGSADVEHPADEAADQPAGIPEFWLTALRNHEMLDSQVRASARARRGCSELLWLYSGARGRVRFRLAGFAVMIKIVQSLSYSP